MMSSEYYRACSYNNNVYVCKGVSRQIWAMNAAFSVLFMFYFHFHNMGAPCLRFFGNKFKDGVNYAVANLKSRVVVLSPHTLSAA